MSKPVRVDTKGRLRVPVSLLADLKELGGEVFITSEDGESIRIYPLKIWNEIEKRLVRLSLSNGTSRKLLTRAKYFGQAIRIDGQGRVLIPGVLRKTAQIRGEVDVLDYENYLEVWNHARLLQQLKRAPVTQQDENVLNSLAS